MNEKYLGLWELIPDLCIYERGEIPAEGHYHITRRGDQLVFNVSWRMSAGAPISIEFAGPPDGSPQPWNMPGATLWTLTRISDAILDSEAFQDGTRAAYARRRVSPDAQLMSVLQVAYLPDGASIRNFQVYSRK